MGKAIVIDGLQVNNPLCVVTFTNNPLENIVGPYYAANTSINAEEKSALETFIQSLLDNEIWSKMKYFYPMLGDNLNDMKIDLVSPSTEDILANISDSGLSVANRVLIANNKQLAASSVGDRASALDLTKLGCAVYGKMSSWIGTGQRAGLFRVNASNYVKFETHSGNSANGYELYGNGGTAFLNEVSTSILESITFGNKENGSVYVYRDDALRASATATDPVKDSNWGGYGIFANSQSADYKWGFMAITEGMTEGEWKTKLYPALLQYLVALGRHSA